MDWEIKLEKFMSCFPYKDEIMGVLVSGSYITGSPNKNSDLDVNLITENRDLSLHGKRIVDGLVIAAQLSRQKSKILIMN